MITNGLHAFNTDRRRLLDDCDFTQFDRMVIATCNGTSSRDVASVGFGCYFIFIDVINFYWLPNTCIQNVRINACASVRVPAVSTPPCPISIYTSSIKYGT